jgi:hypothetical protein
MAEKPCAQCFHYDPIIRGTREARHGRCAMKSVYPTVEQPGRSFPAGVKRAEPGELAEPEIVVGHEIIKTCNLFRARPQAPAPAKKVRR